MAPQELRLAELLAALSVATDLGMGQPPEKAIRSCVVAAGLARAMDLPDEQVREVYLATLLRHLGCTATARDEAHWFGDDELTSRPAAERADFASVRDMVSMTLGAGRGSGVHRPRHLARAMAAGRQGELILTAVCEVATALARRLRCGQGVCDAPYQAMERWDGKGSPQGLAGEEVAVAARISDVANQAVIFDLESGADAAVTMVARRAGGWFDPSVAEAFGRCGRALLREVDQRDPWEAVLDTEPDPAATVGPSGFDELAATFADMVDLKSPFTLGHSSGVAGLAAGAAQKLAMAEQDITALRRAGLFHDLGRVAVSSGIWEKPTILSTAERDRSAYTPTRPSGFWRVHRRSNRSGGSPGCTMSGWTAAATTANQRRGHCRPPHVCWRRRTSSRR